MVHRIAFVLCSASLVFACEGDESSDTSQDVTADSDSALDTAPSPDTTSAHVLIDCHSLEYTITCDKPQADNNGYLACADYFGDTTGVSAQCSVVGPNVEVREGGPACAGYTHYVGSCIYFVPQLSDRCYVTHVGAVSADKIEAGRNFWRTACSGEWRETLEP